LAVLYLKVSRIRFMNLKGCLRHIDKIIRKQPLSASGGLNPRILDHFLLTSWEKKHLLKLDF